MSFWIATIVFVQAYWSQQQDVTDPKVLQDAVIPFGLDASELLSSSTASQILRDNTTEASERGAFGVPRCVYKMCCRYLDNLILVGFQFLCQRKTVLWNRPSLFCWKITRRGQSSWENCISSQPRKCKTYFFLWLCKSMELSWNGASSRHDCISFSSHCEHRVGSHFIGWPF